MTPIVGIDFGTTNTVVALSDEHGTTTTARFPVGTDMREDFRSVLCFWTEDGRAGGPLRHAAGPAGIEAYVDDPLDTRLIMSMKTYLAQKSFVDTRVFGRPFTLPAMIGTFLRALAEQAGFRLEGARIVAGRPVRFAGEFADDVLGERRLRESFAAAGMPAVETALEPEAAGHRFARGLTAPATVLIGDFGGGTSDFSVLRFAPGMGVTPLGHAGIGIAGDTFDYRIVDKAISPRLGKGDVYTVMGKELPVPPEYFSAFARWHRLSMMKAPKTLREIAEVARASKHPERLRGLLTVIEEELGYRLYQSVSGVKAALSVADEALLSFRHKDLVIERMVTRTEFEAWIAEDVARIATAVDLALTDAGISAAAIDHVFLTGGTSFVPAVRRLFTHRFGAAKVTTGGEFVSVAEGLALIGRDRTR